MVQIRTYATATTHTRMVYPAPFRGQTVYLESDTDNMPCYYYGVPCRPQVMHHIRPDGGHICPTGFIWCVECCSIGHEPEPYSCTRRDMVNDE